MKMYPVRLLRCLNKICMVYIFIRVNSVGLGKTGRAIIRGGNFNMLSNGCVPPKRVGFESV